MYKPKRKNELLPKEKTEKRKEKTLRKPRKAHVTSIAPANLADSAKQR